MHHWCRHALGIKTEILMQPRTLWGDSLACSSWDSLQSLPCLPVALTRTWFFWCKRLPLNTRHWHMLFSPFPLLGIVYLSFAHLLKLHFFEGNFTGYPELVKFSKHSILPSQYLSEFPSHNSYIFSSLCVYLCVCGGERKEMHWEEGMHF